MHQPALGAGEHATVTTGPAVANAVFDATRVRVRQMPFTSSADALHMLLKVLFVSYPPYDPALHFADVL